MSIERFKQNAFDILIQAFIVVGMFFFIPGQQAYGPQEIFFQYGAMLIFVFGYFVPRKRQIDNFALALLFIYSFLNTILFHFEPENRKILLNMFLGFLVIKETSERIDFDMKTLGNALAIFCALNVAWLGLQYNNFDPIFSSAMPQNMPEIDMVGLMGIKASLGILAALSFPFIFYESPLASIICIPLLWFGKSSSAVVAVALSLFWILWFKNRKLFFPAIFCAGFAGILYVLKVDMPSGEFGKRIPVWFAGIRYLAGTNIWFGQGLGAWALTGFTTMQKNGQPQVWLWAHNEFVQFLFEQGLFGAVCIYFYFKNLFKKINLHLEEHQRAIAILISLVLVSFVHFPFHVGKFAGLSCLMLASIEAGTSKQIKIGINNEKNTIFDISAIA